MYIYLYYIIWCTYAVRVYVLRVTHEWNRLFRVFHCMWWFVVMGVVNSGGVVGEKPPKLLYVIHRFPEQYINQTGRCVYTMRSTRIRTPRTIGIYITTLNTSYMADVKGLPECACAGRFFIKNENRHYPIFGYDNPSVGLCEETSPVVSWVFVGVDFRTRKLWKKHVKSTEHFAYDYTDAHSVLWRTERTRRDFRHLLIAAIVLF